MFDKFLKVGATFDWISPTLAFIQALRNGPAVGLRVPLAAGWRTDAIKALLTQRGVKVWGMMIVGDDIIFSVRQAQARSAQSLLARAGIPDQGGLSEAAQATHHQPNGEGRQATSKDWETQCLDGIDRWVERL
jgi:hypothetical protein